MARGGMIGAAVVLAALVSVPAAAQVSLVGDWSGRNHEDPTRGSSELGDFTGMPVTREAIAHADAWDESRWTLQERQCRRLGKISLQFDF